MAKRPEPVSEPGRPPSLLYLIKQVEMAVRAHLDAIVAEADLTVSQYTALTILARHPDMTSAELARHSFVAAQSMAELVAPLLARGLVQRRQDPADRRRLGLSLTPAGRRILRRYEPTVARLEQDIVAGLTPTHVADLKTMLFACRHALQHRPQR